MIGLQLLFDAGLDLGTNARLRDLNQLNFIPAITCA